ncbi:MAG: alpha-E domain-containing protein [bacterium]|nr:alpha-E domain-containing protein [bacterium]
MLSRVADSLYWLSRYLERAEHTARLLDVHLGLMLEQSSPERDRDRWLRVQSALRTACHVDRADTLDVVKELTFDPDNTASILASITAARENARQVRERISTEMWGQINRLYLFMRDVKPENALSVEPHRFFQTMKDQVQMFQGVTDSTMSHNEGWHFIQLGRNIERASAVAALLDVHFSGFPYKQIDHTRSDYFEWVGLLKCCTAFEAYVKVYTADLRPSRIAEYLLLNEDFPHSVRFSADCIQTALNSIADATDTRKSSRVHRLAGKLRAALSYGQIDEIMDDNLSAYLRDIQRQCSDIHTAAYETYVAYPIEVAFR